MAKKDTKPTPAPAREMKGVKRIKMTPQTGGSVTKGKDNAKAN
jgi:hypothetical protein